MNPVSAVDVSVLLPAALAGFGVALLVGVPRPSSLRLDRVNRFHPMDRPVAGRAGSPAGVAAGPGASARARRYVLGRQLGALRGRRPHRDRDRDRERARAMEACAVLSAELRAGRSPAHALAAAAGAASGPTARVLGSAASAAALGGDVPSALTAPAAQAVAVPALLRGLAACWTLCSTTGSGLATAVERLEQAERDAAARRREIDVELAGPRATARLLALLPALGLAMSAGLGAAPLHVLLGTTVGRISLALGVALELVGLRWTSRLVARALAGP